MLVVGMPAFNSWRVFSLRYQQPRAIRLRVLSTLDGFRSSVTRSNSVPSPYSSVGWTNASMQEALHRLWTSIAQLIWETDTMTGSNDYVRSLGVAIGISTAQFNHPLGRCLLKQNIAIVGHRWTFEISINWWNAMPTVNEGTNLNSAANTKLTLFFVRETSISRKCKISMKEY